MSALVQLAAVSTQPASDAQANAGQAVGVAVGAGVEVVFFGVTECDGVAVAGAVVIGGRLTDELGEAGAVVVFLFFFRAGGDSGRGDQSQSREGQRTKTKFGETGGKIGNEVHGASS